MSFEHRVLANTGLKRHFPGFQHGGGGVIIRDRTGRIFRGRICRPFKEPRNRFPAWRPVRKPYLSYWPARLHRLTKSIPRNRFLGPINVYKYGLSRKERILYELPSVKEGLDIYSSWNQVLKLKQRAMQQ
jgi:hypothetical protein